VLGLPVYIISFIVTNEYVFNYVYSISSIFILLVVPATLNLLSRRRKLEDWKGEKNFHRSLFHHKAFLYFIYLVAISALALVICAFVINDDEIIVL
jgi:hypothetical protein